MAPEQKRTSSDEEVDKILAELGILSSGTGSSPQKASPASEKPAAPDSPSKAAAKAPVQDEFTIDMDAFDDIRQSERERSAAAAKPEANSAPRASRAPAAPASSPTKTPDRRKNAGGNASGKDSGKDSRSEAKKRPSQRPPQRPSQRPSQRPEAAQKPASRATQQAPVEHLNVPHRESHLKDELEKMAVSSSTQTGQLTRQLRAGRKLEEITASIPIQQRRQTPRHPSERVQKAAEFAASVAAEKPQKRSAGKTAAVWIGTIAAVAAILVVLFGFVFPIVTVEGSSMAPTLEQGDRLLISGMFYTPADGDVIVTTDNNTLKKQLVKRVIATAGQTVEIQEDGTVLVDGTAIDESYLAEPNALAGDMTYPVTVGDGEVFVMGDNRAHSLDSRDGAVGLIETSEIRGKVLLRFYPFGSFGGVD